jgi:hypothetical protein
MLGKQKKTYREGKPTRVRQDAYLTIATPKLRIVDTKLVKAVRERQAAVGKTYYDADCQRQRARQVLRKLLAERMRFEPVLDERGQKPY